MVKAISMSHLSTPAWHIACRGIRRDLCFSKRAKVAASAGRRKELLALASAAPFASKPFKVLQLELFHGERRELNRAEWFAVDFNQPLAELDLQIAHIHSKWNGKRTALANLKSQEAIIRHRWDKHLDDLRTADEDTFSDWVEMLLPLMPEGSTLPGPPMPDRGPRDSTSEEQLCQALTTFSMD